MNTAVWVPDLFMRRLTEDGVWTLFSPDDVPDLHDLSGRAFAARYAEYEDQVSRGKIPLARQVRAADLWRKILTSLFETGHPWITFKDPANVRSPQDHDRRRPQLQPVHRDSAQHLGRRDRGLQPRLGQPRRPYPGRGA